MVPLVAVSGAECVDALSIAGFSLTARNPTAVTLTKGLRVVVVPDVAMLSPDDLLAILRTAGVPYSEFLDLLSETPTDPAISRLRPSPSSVPR